MSRSTHRNRLPVGGVVYFTIAFLLGSYFAFASVQGNYGLFRRIQVEAEGRALSAQADALEEQLIAMRNKTKRLSDDYLDLDLLDEQARDVLGAVRSDEVVIR
ncbi:Septum formation initiator [Aquimixticola soesokkakensis]|uniref:Septum formation initiator n=1 Tax=Aquimixticola soesokkakensis TaxID=1519096 RepID=A0A1Y5SQK7_9RHOB|nr:septum formation initiator family protein [Aquimixticola soesokkakensis]SLN46158.1 Septum formation initiator [Aquimixticola soesokkakensis]